MGFLLRRGLGRRTALVTVASLTLGLAPSVPSLAAQGDPSDIAEACDGAPSSASRFNDYGTLTARQKAVADCLSNGYVGNQGETDYVLKGGSDGNLNFDANINRAQFAAILNRLGDYLGLPVFEGDAANPTFADVPSHHSFFGEIEELYARGLTAGKGPDTADVDGDGNTTELVYDPRGSVTYGQVLAFVRRMLQDGAGFSMPTGQSHNEFSSDCFIFNDDRDVLDAAGFLRTFNSQADCRAAAPRGKVFDLAATGLDLGVEIDEIESPFGEPAGTMTAVLDHTSRFTDEFANVVVTLLDPAGDPVVGQKVDVFGVPATAGFNSDGTPSFDAFLNIDSTGRPGSGDAPGKIDAADRTTNASGQISVTVGTSATVTTGYQVYAFVGAIGDEWVDVAGTDGETADGGTVTFSRLPSKLVVTMQTSSTGVLPYGTAHTVTYQLLDDEGAPVAVAGLSILPRMDRNPSVGDDSLDMSNVATDANGAAVWTRPGATDPDPDNSGTSTVDTYSGTWDRNRDGVANGSDTVVTLESGTVTFRDAGARTYGSSLIELVDGNSNVADQMGALVESATVGVKVTVVNVYGAAIPNMRVDLRTSDVIQPSGWPKQSSTNSQGVALVQYARTSIADHQLVAWVDANDDTVVQNPATFSDASAKSVTGDGDVRVRWVNPAPEQVSPALNPYSAQKLVGYTDNFLFLASDAVRLPLDGGGKADSYKINGEGVTRVAFMSAIKADEAQDDTVSVTYDADWISEWNLTIVGGGGTPLPIA